MASRTASGLYVASAHERIGPHLRATARKMRLTVVRQAGGGRPRVLHCDNAELDAYRQACADGGWKIVKEELV